MSFRMDSFMDWQARRDGLLGRISIGECGCRVRGWIPLRWWKWEVAFVRFSKTWLGAIPETDREAGETPDGARGGKWSTNRSRRKTGRVGHTGIFIRVVEALYNFEQC